MNRKKLNLTAQSLLLVHKGNNGRLSFMTEAFYRVKEGEFVRHLETQSITKVIAQESIKSR